MKTIRYTETTTTEREFTLEEDSLGVTDVLAGKITKGLRDGIYTYVRESTVPGMGRIVNPLGVVAFRTWNDVDTTTNTETEDFYTDVDWPTGGFLKWFLRNNRIIGRVTYGFFILSVLSIIWFLSAWVFIGVTPFILYLVASLWMDVKRWKLGAKLKCVEES